MERKKEKRETRERQEKQIGERKRDNGEKKREK